MTNVVMLPTVVSPGNVKEADIRRLAASLEALSKLLAALRESYDYSVGPIRTKPPSGE